MGSFNVSCGISKLPITVGEDIVVTYRPSSDSYDPIKDIQPVFFFGKYNDYGTVSEVTDEDDYDNFVNIVLAGSPLFSKRSSHENIIRDLMLEQSQTISFVKRSVWEDIIASIRSMPSGEYWFNLQHYTASQIEKDIRLCFNEETKFLLGASGNPEMFKISATFLSSLIFREDFVINDDVIKWIAEKATKTYYINTYIRKNNINIQSESAGQEVDCDYIDLHARIIYNESEKLRREQLDYD